MAQATVKTVQYIDPRIEPQPDPVYDYVIAPTQNQYYKIPTSGLSDSSVTFNNLTTLGVDRAYLDTFELEITAEITFTLDGTAQGLIDRATEIMPKPCEWTFDSFPFNKCCEQVHVNINGGAFFSEPLSYLRAKERYMDQWRLSRCYENVCPCHKPILQIESGKEYDKTITSNAAELLYPPTWAQANLNAQNVVTGVTNQFGPSIPTRLGIGCFNSLIGAEGLEGGFNNSIVRLGTRSGAAPNFVYENYKRKDNTTVVRVTWREPIFCSPFSSRYDATYGRPLYNITSMDLSFTMQDLGNMIRVANIMNDNNKTMRITSYKVHLESVNLCYQVMTIPPVLNKPLTTLVPYRRFVPYITDFTGAPAAMPDHSGGQDGLAINIKSGVYTMNEVPTAIWIFCAPSKRNYQENAPTTFMSYGAAPTDPQYLDNNSFGNWDSNKLFAYMTHASITMANTTQILNTANVADLYRIAKANGCQDAFWSWAGNDICLPKLLSGQQGEVRPMFQGAGSVLRLKPGVDLIVPDQPLIPGANANNMVFQAECEFILPAHNREQYKYSLWLLFEYVGVAAISPGQCEITMNPLGSGEIIQVSPVMSATSEATEGSVDTTGGWEKIKKGASIAAQIADEGIISKILKHIPGAEKAAEWAVKHGLGEPARKRGRGTSGGAVMGHGMNEWVS